jgi:(2Fe-2S) ferredoxin
MGKFSALLKILSLFAVPECYYEVPSAKAPQKALLHSEAVTLKPDSYWYHELAGTGIVRIVTDFHEHDAKVYPVVLDSSGLEKCMKGEPYEPVDLDGRTPMHPHWSHDVVFGEECTNDKYYIVLRNEDNREHSFGMLMYPS